MNNSTCRIGPVAVRVLERREALTLIAALLARPDQAVGVYRRVVAFCNAHTVNLARRDPELVEALRGALVLNDGVGVDLARKLLYGAPFPANLHGTDLTTAVLKDAPEPLRIFLLGSPPGIAERAAGRLEARFPRHCIVGVRDGFFDLDGDGRAVADAIRATGAQLVLAGMGQPRQERWAAEYGAATGALVMCVGAYLDFTAGAVRRAPRWAQRARMEWLVRLAQEPRRLAGRYLVGNAQFLIGIGADWFRARRID